MATKDWKKTNENEWQKRSKDGVRIISILWIKYNKSKYEYWAKGKEITPGWDLFVSIEQKTHHLKTFKTKSAALKYAKSYMRKH